MDAEYRTSIHVLKGLQGLVRCFVVLIWNESSLIENSEEVSHAKERPEFDQRPEHLGEECRTNSDSDITEPVGIVVWVNTVKDLAHDWPSLRYSFTSVEGRNCEQKTRVEELHPKHTQHDEIGLLCVSGETDK